LKAFRVKLVDQICEASGGRCRYSGKDMQTAHMGMGVSGGDFSALVEDLAGALDAFQVPPHEKDQLLGALAPMRTDIVAKP
jgi:hemoglobin